MTSSFDHSGAPSPSRVVHRGDGIAWLASKLGSGSDSSRFGPEHAIVTSLPDVSEVNLDFDAWRTWFIDAAALACSALHEDGVAFFYQSDIEHDGRWIDKSHLVQLGAERAKTPLFLHQIVCRAPAGTVTRKRPAYSHLLGFSKNHRLQGRTAADVLPQLGEMTWARAMGRAACEAVCTYLLDKTATRVVVDPFCGMGTILAAANRVGLDAIGVELSAKRAALAERLVLV